MALTDIDMPGMHHRALIGRHKSAAVDSGPPELFERPGVVYRPPSD